MSAGIYVDLDPDELECGHDGAFDEVIAAAAQRHVDENHGGAASICRDSICDAVSRVERWQP